MTAFHRHPAIRSLAAHATASWRIAALAMVLASCAYVPAPALRTAPPQLTMLSADQCRQVLHDDSTPLSLEQAARRSAEVLAKLPPDRPVHILNRTSTAAALQTMAIALADTARAHNDLASVVCDRFRLYRAATDALVTGYYEPELPASRRPTERFRFPIYRTPDDLVDIDLGQFCAACAGRFSQGRVRDGQLVPYYSRADIDAGAVAGRGYELAWLDDPVEAYFLHVQGSALLQFEDGVRMQISYSSSNGRPYTSIGRVLVEQGQLAAGTVSLQSLKQYLRAHPQDQTGIFERNARYIFFRAVPSGPIGSAGIPLTAGRSVAADPAAYPPGTMLLLGIQPLAGGSFATAITRLVTVQDTGTAITGPGHIDVFWGTGSTAESLAGPMHNAGEIYVVLPS